MSRSPPAGEQSQARSKAYPPHPGTACPPPPTASFRAPRRGTRRVGRRAISRPGRPSKRPAAAPRTFRLRNGWCPRGYDFNYSNGYCYPNGYHAPGLYVRPTPRHYAPEGYYRPHRHRYPPVYTTATRAFVHAWIRPAGAGGLRGASLPCSWTRVHAGTSITAIVNSRCLPEVWEPDPFGSELKCSSASARNKSRLSH